MAGLFDIWKPHEGAELLYSYTVITVDAHKSISWMHDRMPAILDGNTEVDAWLNYKDVPLSEALKLIRPKDCLAYHAVSPTVGNSRNNSEDCIKPYNIEQTPAKKSSGSVNLMKTWLSSASKTKPKDENDNASSVVKKQKL